MVESTIDKIKDITVERQIRKLAGVIDEQNQKIEAYEDATTDINNLKVSDANQNTEINKLKTTTSEHTTDINELKASDANQTTQINNLKQSVATDKLATESAITALQNKDVEQDGTLTNHSTLIQGITESLVSDVQIMPGTTTGDIKVRLERESAATIDSNNYNLGLPVSAEIIQGTGPSMFKVQITMSSGVKVVSNDFVFTTEAIGTDVYISSFTFKAGNQDGYLSADIGLNNGVTIEANNFLVPTDPNVIANITDLQTRMTNVENTAVTDYRINAIETKNTEQDTKINELEAKNTTQDTAIQQNATDISSLNSEVSGVMSDLDTKADLTNPSQTIKADTTDLRTVKLRDSSDAVSSYLQFNAASDKPVRMEYFNGSEIVDSGYVATVDGSGNPKNFTIPSGGEEWEELDLTIWPTDFVVGDRLKVQIRGLYFTTTNVSVRSDAILNKIFDFELASVGSTEINWWNSEQNCLGFRTPASPSEFNRSDTAKFYVISYNGSYPQSINAYIVSFYPETATLPYGQKAYYIKDYCKIWRLKK